MEAWRTSVPVVPIVPIVPVIPVVLIAPVVPIVPVFPIAPVFQSFLFFQSSQSFLSSQSFQLFQLFQLFSIVSMFQRTIAPSWCLIKFRALVARRKRPRSPLAVFFLSTPYGSMSARVSQEAASWSTRSSSVSQKPGRAVVGAAVSRQAAMWAQRFSWRVCMET